MMKWWMLPRVRRGLALSAIVLSAGGLILHRAPAVAQGTQATSPLQLITAQGNSFRGPGAHGTIAFTQTQVLSGTPQRVYAEIDFEADKNDGVKERAPISLAVVLDTSGSMSGEKIDQAKSAVLKLIANMKDDDQIAFIRYSDTHDLVQPLARLGDVRQNLNRRIQELQADGGTMIAPALAEGKRVLEEAKKDRVRRIVLASDGLDGTRAQSEAFARAAFDEGIAVSSLGIGLDFDEKYMGSVATAGHGNFAFVKDGSSLSGFLNQELLEASSTTISNSQVTLHVPRGMRFVDAMGADAVQHGDDVTLKVGSLFAGDSRRVVCELEVNAAPNQAYTLDADVDWTLVAGERRVSANDVKLELRGTTDSRAAQASQNGAVFANATSVFASKRQLDAAEAYARGDNTRAQQLIDDNMRDLTVAAKAAPAPVASAMARQITSYGATKEEFNQAAPGSDRGKSAAKAAVSKDLGNMKRGSF
jgi:Ca-activated chloride channel family protein